MRDSHVPERAEPVPPAFPEYESRWRLVRDLGVFELKLALDGVKDLVVAPLAAAATLADLVMPRETRGVFLRAVIQLGERFERWLNLYGGRRPEEARSILDEGGSEVIVDYLESKTLDLHRGLKERRKKRRD
jgi:hypothetical protein